uniref:Flavin reductase like domain-containing protein n=1 Tax=Aplanochytrium stocchinoi TaxID=215587 RepID=A0A7S3LNX4_9STRA|mmetsp:Transcript_20278/g.25899  ORF Transcript_20278/g.25899 Transcript_20278/m.25899 type:complete len:314 (+) Transcript_20278:81-1022(+)
MQVLKCWKLASRISKIPKPRHCSSRFLSVSKFKMTTGKRKFSTMSDELDYLRARVKDLEAKEEVQNRNKYHRIGSGASHDQSPNPSWKKRETQPMPFPEETGFQSMVPRDMKSVYQFVISSVVPRPIAFVSTVNVDGNIKANLAPFSYFMAVCHDPLTLAFSTCTKRGAVKKDTLNNLESNGECVVNIISEWFVESANFCSGDFPDDVDEFEVAGLTKLSSDVVRPPRVKEAAVQLECKLKHKYEIVNDKDEHTATMCVVEVVKSHVKKELYDPEKGVVKFEGYRPISRLGGTTYGKVGDTFSLPRPEKDEFR